MDLALSVRRVAAGEHVVAASLNPPTVEEERTKRLAPREKQILQLIAQGKSNKEIAVALNINFGTVNSHRAGLMSVLTVRRTTNLVRYASRNGFTKIQ